jgi:hypothetical protein
MMRNDHSSVHSTEINRIQNGDEGGWEFVCHSCGYRARYTMDKHGTQRLEILFVGDTSARHTSEKVEEVFGASTGEAPEEWQAEWQGPQDDDGLEADVPGWEDDWLPENIQEQVKAILKKFD